MRLSSLKTVITTKQQKILHECENSPYYMYLFKYHLLSVLRIWEYSSTARFFNRLLFKLYRLIFWKEMFYVFLFAPETDHHSGHVISGRGMIQKLVKTTRREWIRQTLLISLLRCKMTFYRVQQENESAIVSSVAVFSARVLIIFKPRKHWKQFFQRDVWPPFSHHVIERYLLITLGKAGAAWVRKLKELFKICNLLRFHQKMVFSPNISVFNPPNYSVFEMLVVFFILFFASLLKKVRLGHFHFL